MSEKDTKRTLSFDSNIYALMRVEAKSRHISVSHLLRLVFMDWFRNKDERKLL